MKPMPRDDAPLAPSFGRQSLGSPNGWLLKCPLCDQFSVPIHADERYMSCLVCPWRETPPPPPRPDPRVTSPFTEPPISRWFHFAVWFIIGCLVLLLAIALWSNVE